MSAKVVLERELDDEFCSDVLVTACDAMYGGIWYWARSQERKPDEPSSYKIEGEVWRSVAIVEKEASGGSDPMEFVVDHAAIGLGIERLFAPGFKVADRIRGAVASLDAGNIDSEAADVIVQAAMFGEIVYG